MTKYKRWILLLTALTVFVVHIESLKATSLIHAGKFSKLLNTTTTTTTTEVAQSDLLKEILAAADEQDDGKRYVEVNGTKIALTGIPQIDYVWDPNLPRELNGFNLSSYPFIDSMPAEEDIGFDCEDKINGFYASIKFGCQIYHHCLYGARSDFICANFTAFDQKTFICHFASEVDCKNSYKYWSRNEDLYKATTEKSTTSGSGLVPLIDRNLYKRPAPGAGSFLNGGSQNKENSNVGNQQNNNNPPPARVNSNNEESAIANPPIMRTPNRPLRRPYRRRRPQIDYYYYDDEYEDEIYDDRSRRRQQRPRNRRPVYDDYDNRRPEARRPADDDFDDYEYDRRPYRSRNRSESRRQGDDRRKTDDRRFDDRRRPYNDDRRPVDDRKKPIEDERRSYDDRRPSDERTPVDERKRKDEDRSQSDDRKSNRRKNHDDSIDEKRKERTPAIPDRAEKNSDDGDAPKPVGSLFDRPRVAPKISRPVPLSEKNKFAYNKSPTVEGEKKAEQEYEYEEYADTPVASPTPSTSTSTTTTTTTTTIRTTTKYVPRFKSSTVQGRKKPTTTATTTTTTTAVPTTAQEIEYYDDDEYYDTMTPVKPFDTTTYAQPKNDLASLIDVRFRSSAESFAPLSTTTPTSATDNSRFNRFKSTNEKILSQVPRRDYGQKTFEESSVQSTSRKPLPSLNSKKFANQQTLFESTTVETPRPSTQSNQHNVNHHRYFGRNNEQPETETVDDRDLKSVVRVVKRPFLPSRGGSPYKGRGLQPVGPAALHFDQPLDNHNSELTAPDTELSSLSNENTQQHNNEQPQSFLTNPNTQQPLQHYRDENHKTTLEDIYNEEYDVELNDALNPMLKPLTSSRAVGGYSFSSIPNVEKDGVRSQSQKNIQKTEAPKTSTTTTTESPLYDYEEVEYEYK